MLVLKSLKDSIDFRQIIGKRPIASLFLHPAPARNHPQTGAFTSQRTDSWRLDMGRGLLLWLLGIPLPIILVIWLLGGLS